MAVLGRLLVSSAERLDLPDLLSIDSYAAGDWKYFLKGMVGDSKPFVLKGFDIINPNGAIGEENCAIRVADSVVFYPGSSAGSFFHGLEEGHAQAAPLIPELRKNATNYVYLTFTTINTSTDTRAFWDPDKDGGVGGEFTQDINTESVLKVEVNVSVGSFPANTIPVAIIKVGALTIESIKDARHLLFRLGTGGLNPDPFGDYSWRSLPSATFQRTEPPTTITSSTGNNPFQGADKNIQSMKEWMDAVMSKLRELGGTAYWYEDISTFSVISTFVDSCATAFKSKGRWIHDSGTPGDLTWTEDINLKVTNDLRTYIIRAGNAAPFTGHTVNLADEEVLYVEMIRNQPINASDQPVQWTVGSNYVNSVGGAIGLFSKLKQGDWIKKIDDSNSKFLRVEGFYDGFNGGSSTNSANAKSIKLSANYAGSTAVEKARYDQGEYLASDTIVSTRDQAAISTAGGNFHWLAARSDTIQKIDSINEVSFSIVFSDADGDTVKVTSIGNHGLNDGDWINVSGSVGFNGNWQVEVESATVFYINSSITASDSGTATYSIVTTTARDNGDGFQLESANHGLRDGDKIKITGTVSHDGTYLVNSSNGSVFRISGMGTGNESSVGLATLARLMVRTEGSVVQVVQGQTVDIGASAADNMRQYIGMASLTEVNPLYNIPPSYNTLDGMANYNSTINENLTTRIAKLTAMMADKAQDRTMQMVMSGTHSVTNTTNGPNQDITFNPNFDPPQRLDIILPGSDFSSGSVGLTGTLSLAVNQVAYIDIDRNSTFSIVDLSDSAVVVKNIVNVPISENILVLAVRLSSTDIWLWNGLRVTSDRPALMPNYVDLIIQQNRLMKLVRGGLWNWDLLDSELSWSNPAFVQMPGLTEDSNEIAVGSITLSNDGDVAYVDLNRNSAAGASILSVQVGNIQTMDIHPDRVIIARRVFNNVEVGMGTIVLTHGESRSLDRDSNLITVEFVDILHTSLPSGSSMSIDGTPLSNGVRVLFTKSPIEGVYVVNGIGTALTWTKLDVFGGNSNPYIGSTVVCSDGSNEHVNIWRRDIGNWKPVDDTEVQKEPTGFPNRVDSELSFVGSTFTIAPVDEYFDVYQKGVPYRFDTAQTLTNSWTEGLHYFYFDAGILNSTQSFSIEIIKQYAFVATMYWDAVTGSHVMLSDERHGLTMDGETHAYLHESVGARYISGLSAGNFTTSGTGAADSDAQISISNGSIRDEDISFDIVDANLPSNPYEQILDPVAEIPILYRDGINGFWKKELATSFAIKQGSLRAQWNQYSGGSWSTVDASTDGNYIAMWLFATNNQEAPIIGIMGQREDLTLNDAQANNVYEDLLFGDMPSAEMKVIYRLIFKTDSTFINSPKSALASVLDLRRAIDTALGPYSPSDHGLLSGLTDQDHPDYAIRVEDPSAYSGALKQIELTDNDDVQKSLQSLDRFFGQLRIYPHPSDTHRVKISSSDHLLTNDITLTQTVRSLIMSFDGAEIDFSTGSIYAADGVSSLGINFTPITIPANNYHWYSIGLKTLSPVLANNTVSVQVLVTPAAASNLILGNAPRAKFKGNVKLGQVWIKENGGSISPITASNIYQLGVGSGGGGSGEESYDFQLVNNQSLPADVVDFLIETSDNKMFKAEYSIARRYLEPASLAPGGNLDTSFDTGFTTAGTGFGNALYGTVQIEKVLYQPDGKILVGGEFSHYDGVPRSNILRLNADGTLDTSFAAISGAGSNNAIRTIALQSDGKILIGGDFTSYSGEVRNRIARLNSDGSLDNTFYQGGAGFNHTVKAIVIQSDGKIVAGGEFNNYEDNNGVHAVQYLTRLNTDGSLDTSFAQTGSGLNGAVNCILIGYDNGLHIGGKFTNYNGTPRSYLAKLTSNGELDLFFDQVVLDGLNGFVNVIIHSPDSDGSIIVGGSFSSYAGGTFVGRLARFTANGSLSLNTGHLTAGEVYDMASSIEGITVVGDFSQYDFLSVKNIITLSTSFNIMGDTLNNSFRGGTTGIIRTIGVKSILEQIDSGIMGVIGGDFASFTDPVTAGGSTYNTRVVQILTETNTVKYALDSSFNTVNKTFDNYYLSQFFYINRTFIQPDGKILVGGLFNRYNGTIFAPYLTRLNSDGSLDNTFAQSGSGFDNAIRAIAVQPDGKIIVGGDFTSYNGATRLRIARLNSDGSLDTSFASSGGGFLDTVRDVSVLSTGKILVSGNFTSHTGGNRLRIARLNSDGSLDTSFGDPSYGISGIIYAMIVDQDEKILVGGNFTNYDSVATPRMARLNSDGSLDTSFVQDGTGLNSSVRAITLQADNKILIGGAFTSYNGVSRSRMARLNPDGTLDTSFALAGTGLDNTVYSIAVQPNNNIVIGGNFTNYNGNTQSPKVAILLSNGDLDTSFAQDGVGFTGGAGVNSVSLDSSGKIIVGTQVYYYNGVSVDVLLRMNASNNVPETLIEYMTQGSVSGIYRPSTGVWTLQGETYTGDDPEVALSITSTGQVQYTSSNLPGTELESMIKFKITRL